MTGYTRRIPRSHLAAFRKLHEPSRAEYRRLLERAHREGNVAEVKRLTKALLERGAQGALGRRLDDERSL